MNNRQIGIGLMGLGVIGSGVARALRDKAVTLEERAAAPVILKKILEIDTTKHGTLGLDRGLFTTDFQSIIGDPEIDVVIELIGGENPAYDFISKALSAGKHVVTANKELMAKHGYELLSMARTHKVYLRFEASVGGGIPLIAPFQRDLVVNDVLTIYGILNGTTNYILTRMADDGLDFGFVLFRRNTGGGLLRHRLIGTSRFRLGRCGCPGSLGAGPLIAISVRHIEISLPGQADGTQDNTTNGRGGRIYFLSNSISLPRVPQPGTSCVT